MSMTSARRALRHLPLMAAFLAAGELSAKTKPLPEEPKTAPPAPTVSAAEAANKQAIMDALLIPVRHVFMLACGSHDRGAVNIHLHRQPRHGHRHECRT